MAKHPLRVVVLTGAGISADSGVATFRGGGGLWEGHRVEDVATPAAWRRNPTLVWRFYQMRRAQLGTVAPNPAHAALVEFERELTAGGHAFTLVTQNVDNLHQRAGSHPLPMHGELAVLRCEACDHDVMGLDYLDPEKFLPCPACGHARVRPDIVWFGEMPKHMDVIADALSGCTHFVSIGTSGVVYPAAGFLAEARSAGARTFVCALDEPENLHPRDQFHPGRAAEILPQLVRAWLSDWPRG